MSAVGVGIVGSGVISDTYLANLGSFPDVEVKVVGDLNPERARAQAEKHGVPRSGTAADVMASDDVQVVVNLTIPAAHVEVSTQAIEAGKHVWTEKPIGLELDGVDELLARAAERGLRIGSAPDTVLGPGLQTAKRAIQSGRIGEPLFAQTTFQTQGPDVWHPGPQFLFSRGAGPLFDMGPYYFSALVSLLGPIARVGAAGMRARTEREIRTGPNAGSFFPVEVPTTLQAITIFESGRQAQSTFSFDSALERHGVIEVHGTEGSIIVPDPNRFSGRTAVVKPLLTFRDGEAFDQPWIEIPEEGVVVGRGLGLLEMVRAIAEERPHLASGELGRHVLETMIAADESAQSGSFIDVESTVAPIPAVPVDFDPFARTLP
ncbi:Gfo/Idh/MocA family oxidoreductase [Microbacterium aoyamense]|uniref:Gfo/Idh/MocA family oxidoreductase n=1 Tax=Microbacterium aoyamense TaxID=344166 RepID=A0ABP5APZ2_9MICO|nr:Gfo/Idh/MocA family oxidoreductase [Microbacterium aoyamense]